MELARHIEIQLLESDCVIVPDLGGFMAHHIEAHYDEEDQLFLPPQRTLGFNPQLKLNDSLLAQSYIEAYDISYPEALRRINSEVTELKQRLSNDGYFELNGIGVLTINREGHIEFEPCEAGILTPTLYGLSSYEFEPLQLQRPALAKMDSVDDDDDSHTRTISINMRWVRNAVAIAIAIFAFFFISEPVTTSHPTEAGMTQVSMPDLKKDTPKINPAPAVAETDSTIVDTEDTIATEEKIAGIAEEKTGERQEEVKEEEQQVKELVQEPVTTFCIVLASQVTQSNAEEFVEKLHARGLKDARIYVHNHIRRVICGNYATHEDAHEHLSDIQRIDGLYDAWVYQIKK